MIGLFSAQELFSAKEPYVTGLFSDRASLRKRALQKRFTIGLFSAKEPYVTGLFGDIFSA